MNNIERYNIIESGYDSVAKSNYNLYSIPYNELKIIVRSWYSDIDLNVFDDTLHNDNAIKDYEINKLSGIVSNIFFAYHEDGVYYLLDGFKRLLSSNGEIDSSERVYIKVYTDKLKEYELNNLLFIFNQWKINSDRNYKFVSVYDRGIKLFYKVKFNIDLYRCFNYNERVRNVDDMNVLDSYFMYDCDYGNFYNSNADIYKLMKSECVVDDIRNIVAINDYLEQPFGNYRMFIEGYCRFISYQRIIGNTSSLPFDFFVNELKNDKVFYKKLIGMSGNESTRKNIYKFFMRYEAN